MAKSAMKFMVKVTYFFAHAQKIFRGKNRWMEFIGFILYLCAVIYTIFGISGNTGLIIGAILLISWAITAWVITPIFRTEECKKPKEKD